MWVVVGKMSTYVCTCLGVHAQRALQQVVDTLCHIDIQTRVAPLQHDLIDRSFLINQNNIMEMILKT